MDVLYPVISSLSNPRVKNVVKLRQRSHREQQGLMIIEGYRELRRALAGDCKLTEAFICPERFMGENNQALIDELVNRGIHIWRTPPHVFDKMAYRDRPDGLLATAPRLGIKLSDITLSDCPLIIVAEAIEKPGNLGTIMRSADATGADAVIVCDRCTDITNPNVVRASVGTIFTVPVVEATSEETLAWLALAGVAITATTPHTDLLYTDVDLREPTAVVVGTEQYGLSDRWLQAATHRVRIPMLGDVDSLNVASATSLVLYEAVRQRGLRGRVVPHL
jgi:TrmH family RNA methyltransferase